MRLRPLRRVVGLNVVLLSCIAACLIFAGCAKKPAMTVGSGPGGNIAVQPVNIAPAEEFRGMFVTTAHNVDWPSQAGLHQNVQLNEIEATILRAKDLNCNAIILQARAFGDRMHRDTKIVPPEKWAQSLNFTNDPGYDPLSTWVTRCHEEGLQFYAWVNPFRTDWPVVWDPDGPQQPRPPTTLPFYASDDGNHLMLDHTSLLVQEYVLEVIEDLLDNVTDESAMSGPPPGEVMLASVGGTARGTARGTTGGTTAATTVPGGDDDGVDGVVVDHYLPDEDRPPPLPSPPAPGVRALRGPGASAAAGGATTQPMALIKKPAPRIAWLVKSNLMPVPYVFKKEKDPTGRDVNADRFIEEAYNLVNGRNCKFGISPGKDQVDQPHANAKKWLQMGWCHYFMPELYFEPGQFQTALDNWIHLNTPPNPTEPNRKPLLVPVIITRAAEVPYEGKLWTVADLEQEINYAQSKGVGQVHYTSRSLRAHAHGGPKDNVGDKAKGNQYKHRKLPPPANAPAGALPDPVVNSTAAGVMLSVPNTKVKYWAVWVEDANGNFGEPEIQHGRKSRVTGVASGRKVRVQASDRFDRKSPVVEFTFP